MAPHRAGLSAVSLCRGAAPRSLPTAPPVRTRPDAGARFDEDTATDGLKASVAEAAGCTDFAVLKGRLLATAQGAFEIYHDQIETPAAEARARLGAKAESSE